MADAKITNRTTAEFAAREFFWPSGYWGGYARFFEPKLSSKVGQEFMHAIHDGLKTRDVDAAIKMLSETHTKRPNGEVVVCVPTNDASIAIELLEAVKNQNK